jgi:hypothetical protein
VVQRAVDGSSPGHDDVHLQAHQLVRESGYALAASIGKSCLDDEVLAFDVSELAHAVHEGLVAPSVQRGLTRAEVEETDARDLRLRLGE